MEGRTGKVALAKGLGLLRPDQVRFIEGVARVRNRYAHNVRNMHRPLQDILSEEQQGNGKIVEDVTGNAGAFMEFVFERHQYEAAVQTFARDAKSMDRIEPSLSSQ